MYRVFEATLKFAFWWRKFNGATNSEAILSQVFGKVKRDGNNNTNWHDHWSQLSDQQKTDATHLKEVSAMQIVWYPKSVTREASIRISKCGICKAQDTQVFGLMLQGCRGQQLER